MSLLLQRTDVTTSATFGKLWLGEDEVCVTLEDPPRDGKGPIPAGRYKVHVDYSPRFQALLPWIDDVPGFTDIRIHAGNTSKDTEGCILTGVYRVDARSIADSRMALGRLLTRWRDWHERWITVRDP